jgi:hypothetical protein
MVRLPVSRKGAVSAFRAERMRGRERRLEGASAFEAARTESCLRCENERKPLGVCVCFCACVFARCEQLVQVRVFSSAASGGGPCRARALLVMGSVSSGVAVGACVRLWLA